MRSKKCMIVLCIVIVSLAMSMTCSKATMEEEENECADQLGNLASCIPFVSGTAKRPTPECCEATKKVKTNKPKCLCVLIKESNDPSMGLPVNTTLALQMPSACNIDAKISDCPSILNIPPNSPEAKIFMEADPHATAPSTSTNAPHTSTSTFSGSSSSTSSVSGSKPDSKTTTNSNDTTKSKIISSTNVLLLVIMTVASTTPLIFV